MKRSIHSMFLAGLLCLLTFCDPSDFQLPVHQIDLIVPLFDIELSIDELMLADSAEIIRKDSNGFVHLHYEMTESRRLEDMAPIDDTQFDFTIPGISGAIPDFNINIPLGVQLLGIDTGYYANFDPGVFNYELEADLERFINADFDSGFVGLEMTNNIPFILSTGMVIELINEGESIPFHSFTLTQNLNPGETFLFQDEDLSDKSITGSFTLSIKNLATPGASDIHIKPEDALDPSIVISAGATDTSPKWIDIAKKSLTVLIYLLLIVIAFFLLKIIYTHYKKRRKQYLASESYLFSKVLKQKDEKGLLNHIYYWLDRSTGAKTLSALSKNDPELDAETIQLKRNSFTRQSDGTADIHLIQKRLEHLRKGFKKSKKTISVGSKLSKLNP